MHDHVWESSHPQSADDRGAPSGQATSFVRRALIAVGLVALAVLIAGVLWYAVDVLMVAFAGVLFAVGLRGLSDWVRQHTRLSSGWALALVTGAIAVLFALVVTLFAASIAQQVTQLTQQLPQSAQEARQRVEQLPGGQQIISLVPQIGGGGQQEGGGQQGSGGQSGVASGIASLFSTSLGLVANVALISFLALYFAADPDLYITGAVRLVPKTRRKRARDVLHTLGYTLRWWLLGQLLSMTVVGVLTGLGLLLLGVPLAPVLGLLAGLLDFVPTVGPIIAAVPGVLLAFSQGSTTGLLAIGLYVLVQILEGYVLYPLIQERAVKLPPALTILSLAVMGVLLGALGLLLATPLLVVVLTLVKMLYVEDALGDQIDVPGEPSA